MPAWVWVTAAVAAGFVAWVGWGRSWWRSVRYSWSRAAHVIEVTEREFAAENRWQGSMILAEERALHREGWLYTADGATFLPAPAPDWREQTATELSPEALERLCGPEQSQERPAPDDSRDGTWSPGNENRDRDTGPGPGGEASSLAPGPDQSSDDDELGTSALVGAWEQRQRKEEARMRAMIVWPDTRLADTGDIASAHLLAEIEADLRAQDDDCALYLSRLRSACAQYRLDLAAALA